MKTWQKVVLILAGSGVLSVAVLGVLGYHFVWKKKDALMAASMEADTRGRSFGAGRPKGACVDESMRLLKVDSSFQQEMLIRIELGACLEVAELDDGLCEGVPPSSELMRSATWAVERCEARQMGADQACSRVIRRIQDECE